MMVNILYLIVFALLFFPAIGFVALKLTSEETKKFIAVRRVTVFLFCFQTLNFILIPVTFLLSHSGVDQDFLTLQAFLFLYAGALISLISVVMLPDFCQADKIVGRLLQIYVILFLLLLLTGLMLAPILHSFGSTV